MKALRCKSRERQQRLSLHVKINGACSQRYQHARDEQPTMQRLQEHGVRGALAVQREEGTYRKAFARKDC